MSFSVPGGGGPSSSKMQIPSKKSSTKQKENVQTKKIAKPVANLLELKSKASTPSQTRHPPKSTPSKKRLDTPHTRLRNDAKILALLDYDGTTSTAAEININAKTSSTTTTSTTEGVSAFSSFATIKDTSVSEVSTHSFANVSAPLNSASSSKRQHQQQPDALLLLEDFWVRTKSPLNYNMILQHQVQYVDVPSACSDPVPALAKPVKCFKKKGNSQKQEFAMEQEEEEVDSCPEDPAGFLQCMTVLEAPSPQEMKRSKKSKKMDLQKDLQKADSPKGRRFSLFMSTGDWSAGAARLDIKFFKEGNSHHFAESGLNLSHLLEERERKIFANRDSANPDFRDEITDKTPIVSIRRRIKIGSLKFKLVFGVSPAQHLLDKILLENNDQKDDLQVVDDDCEKLCKIHAKSSKTLQEEVDLLTNLQSHFPGLAVPSDRNDSEDVDGVDDDDDIQFDAKDEESAEEEGDATLNFDIVASDDAQEFDLPVQVEPKISRRKNSSVHFNLNNDFQPDNELDNNSNTLHIVLTPGERERRDMKTSIKKKTDKTGKDKSKDKSTTKASELAVIHFELQEKVAALAGQVSSYSTKLVETEMELNELREEVQSLKEERVKHLQILDNSCEKIDSLKRSLTDALVAVRESELYREQVISLEKKTTEMERVNRLIQVMTVTSSTPELSPGSFAGSPNFTTSIMLDKIEASLGLGPISKASSPSQPPPTTTTTTTTTKDKSLPSPKPSSSSTKHSSGRRLNSMYIS